jgi:hypothetical protein
MYHKRLMKTSLRAQCSVNNHYMTPFPNMNSLLFFGLMISYSQTMSTVSAQMPRPGNGMPM